MFSYGDLADLIDWAGVYPMTNGWQVIIRAEWTDVSAGRPHGVSYGLVLKDAEGNRLLGFDNSHLPDGGEDGQPFDTSIVPQTSPELSHTASVRPRCSRPIFSSALRSTVP